MLVTGVAIVEERIKEIKVTRKDLDLCG